MGFCHRCGDLVHGANCLKCGGRSVSSVTSGLQSNTRNDPWINAYQNILDGGISKPSKRMSMPAVPALSTTSFNKPQPLVLQKQCHGCSKEIRQARVFVEPGKPNFIYCEKCYVEKFAKGSCPTCLKPVMSKTDPYITHNKRTFHSACFKCYKCYIDVSTKPMVDLRGRPCCEECLMSQAGAGSDLNNSSPTLQGNESHLSTPGNRSMTSSPGPSPSPLPRSTMPSSQYHNLSGSSTTSNNNNLEVATDLSARLQLNLSPLDLNLDHSLMQQTPSPLSAQSVSSQSSMGASSFRQNTPSSGYTSGTSSTYSSLGRKRSDSLTPSVLPPSGSTSTANMLRPDHQGSPVVGSPLLSFRRPSSALSIHSYTSTRTNSPAPGQRQDQESENAFKSGTDYPDTVERDQDAGSVVENTSESTLHGLRRSRSRSMVGVDDLGPSLSRDLQRPNEAGARSRDDSRPGTPGHKTPVIDQYPSSNLEADLATPIKNLSLSSTHDLIQPRTEQASQQQQQQQTPPRPMLGRARSRSSVGPLTSASVRARTEAYMNQAQSTTTSPPTSRSSSQLFNANRGSTIFNNLPPKQPSTTTMATISTTGSTPAYEKESRLAPSDAEPSRSSSMQRHGRQRSNTVGEAISFPTVKIADSVESSPAQQRAIAVAAAAATTTSGTVPEGHCHKCLEKVTENGVRLQNGDRFHIACFLCHGCKQVFTESEFHVVMGRPYHPQCVSMAGATSTMGVVTKCQQCHKVIGNRSIRFSGMNYHPQCFTCSHCSKVLTSTSRFFEVEGQVECEQCCDERDNKVRMPPKIVPVPRATDHFPLPAMTLAEGHTGVGRRGSGMSPLEPSGPGMMASSSSGGNMSRSGSGYGSPSSVSGASSPPRSPGSPLLIPSSGSGMDMNHGSEATSPVLVMTSPLTQRATPPALTSFFGTRTRPLPKFGGVTTCPRCKEAVGVMDQVPGPKNEKWHKKCLNCKECKKVLDSSALTRAEGEAFCRGCYNKTRSRV